MIKRRNIILKIIMLVIIVMAMMIQTSMAASTTGVINYDTVRVRKDPEPDLNKTKTYALVSIGDKVEVLEKSGDWYKIRCTYEGKEVTGYVREDLIDVKNPEKLKDTSENSSNNNSSSSSNASTEKPSTSSSEEKPNNTEKPSDTTEPTSAEPTQEPEEPNNTENPSTENPDTTQEKPVNQTEKTLTTLKVEQTQKEEGTKINLTKDVHIKILPVVNSTNIGTITAGTEATVVEVVNQWIRIETEELIGWARIES
ncbi:MAG: hypothetical protein HFJ48_07075 [Clostridia bacterium]|nr:hypothetical protein [Clostridia bacterium]